MCGIFGMGFLSKHKDPKFITQLTTELLNSVEIRGTDASGVASVNLYYNDGSDRTKTMAASGNDVYSAEIGPYSVGTTVSYSLDATASGGNTETATTGTYSFTVQANQEIIELGNVSSFETYEVSTEETQVSFSTTVDVSDVDVYYSWIGGSLGVGVAGGLSGSS